MKKLKRILLIHLLFIGLGLHAQTVSNSKEAKNYIEVTGIAEKMIVPDEIYIAITLVDEPKRKYDLNQQEEDLKQAISSLGIDLKNLTLSHAYAGYVYRKWKKRDVQNSISYTLKVRTAQHVSGVFEKLDEIGIQGARISRVSHSNLVNFKKEVRIDAIKAAKAKASYLLEAIDEKIGKPITITESPSTMNPYWSYKSNSIAANSVSFAEEDVEYQKIGNVQFKKIKVQSSIYVKFEIQ